MTHASRVWAQTEGYHRGSKGLDCTYNLFCRSGCDSLVCAVPLDRPVPGFLAGQEWLFVRSLHPSDPLPPGFSAKAASEAARFNGFYLFYLLAKLVPDPDRLRSELPLQPQAALLAATDAQIRAHVHTILDRRFKSP